MDQNPNDPVLSEAIALAGHLREQAGAVLKECLPEGWGVTVVLSGPAGSAWSCDPTWCAESINRLLMAIGRKVLITSKIQAPATPAQAQN